MINRIPPFAVIAMLFLVGCSLAKNTENEGPGLPEFDKAGHRGARGLMPENTVPAMLKALDLGVTTLEMDAHVTKDGYVVLSHDPYFNPSHELLPNGAEIPPADKRKYALYQMNYSEIKKFDIGSKIYTQFPQQQKLKTYKPLLSEVIDKAQAHIQAKNLHQVYYNIETKSKPETDGQYHPAPEEFVDRIMAVIRRKQLTDYVIIQSFDVRTLQIVNRKYPNVKTSLLVDNKDGLSANLQKLGFTPTIYSPHYKLVDAKLVEAAHIRNIKVIPWTVNAVADMQQLRQLNVDGIISDYPNLFNQL
ncbi:glycerophosphodiester phosphodiesterase family protein [Pontibacter harenae]|uniref:glycerophosphodiester phosphodiesterase family protein n=1 Tax=Pontibacter harenae TaxID=2894083 RepID=UPI001E3D0663|nr:glycerophosphodiester phosphodiesterase family protein [Pontibacter harenae]MCC9165570.1 glycerophosphodiester phosphodiesterase [Pontibacter harenae]